LNKDFYISFKKGTINLIIIFLFKEFVMQYYWDILKANYTRAPKYIRLKLLNIHCTEKRHNSALEIIFLRTVFDTLGNNEI